MAHGKPRVDVQDHVAYPRLDVDLLTFGSLEIRLENLNSAVDVQGHSTSLEDKRIMGEGPCGVFLLWFEVSTAGIDL